MAVKVRVQTEAEVKALERYQAELDDMRKKIVTSNKSVEEMTKELRKLDAMQRTLNKTTGDTSGKMGGLNKLFGHFTITAGDVVNGLRWAGEQLLEFGKAGAEAEKATRILQTAVERAGYSWGANAKAIDANIQKVSWLAAVDDEELYVAQSKLVRSTGDLTESQKLLGLATDISAMTGIELDSVTKALGKAYNGNFTALLKLGVALGDTTDKTAAFKTLYEQFGGAAAYVNDNLAADADRVTIAWDNLKESAGQAFGPELSTNLQNSALGLQLLSSETLGASEKWEVFLGNIGKSVEEQNEATAAALGLSGATDSMTAAQMRATQAATDLTTAQNELAGIQVTAEQASINLERAANRMEDADRKAAEALGKYGEGSREYEDALLDVRQAKLDLQEATDKMNENQATLDATQREIDRLAVLEKSLKRIADAKAAGAYVVGSGTAKNAGARAEGGPVYSGTTYLVGEDGPELFRAPSSGTIIPTDQTIRLLGGGTSSPIASTGPTFDFSGAVFGSGVTKAEVQGWFLDALAQVSRSSGYLKV